jgi:DNA-binding response OmpR family regulator
MKTYAAGGKTPTPRKFVEHKIHQMTNQAPHILLMEEEPTLLDITAFRLELLGYTVTCMETAQEATLWLKDNLPDLIAVGQLTDMKSVEFLNLLSNDPRTSELPMIYVSARADLMEVQQAYNAGADEFLVTPYNPMVLEKKVEGLLIAAKS